MTLLDRNLEKLKENLKGTFRPTSVYYLASEALSALEALHSINYVHRDVKPTNFSIGVGPAASRLFLIDYGDTVKSGKTIKYSIPDAYSLPYMAIDMHKRTAATPKVDIEAWFYTFAELLYPQILSWKRCHEETELAEVKAKFWSDVPESVSICSPQIIDLAKAINSISDKVDYAALRRLLDDAQNSSLKGAPLTLEWTKMPTKPEAKQGSAPVAPGSVIDPEKSPLAADAATDIPSGQTTPMGGEKTSAMGLFTRFLAQRRKEAEAGATAQPQTETAPQKGGTGEEKGSGEKREKGDAGQSPEKPNADGTEKKSDKASGEGSQSTGSKSKSAEKTSAENKAEGGSGSAKKKSTSGSAEKKGSAEKATSTESKDKRGSAEMLKTAYKKPVEATPDAKKPTETADKKEEAKTGTAPDQTPKENKLMKFWKRFKKKE
ncbi:unnamed protein product [Nippostrongylus brasiliensis]|uniref:Protein kinase domain-containing protein n=1 Tax=Nippostrongylus brasiliensis TaxID=27835 RepID=A0A0N4YZ02_NIPBR|nr:unnamed protein product [Nippostrongylus brasiliensis]